MGVLLDKSIPRLKAISGVRVLRLKYEGIGFNIIFDNLTKYLIGSAILIVVEVTVLCQLSRCGILYRILSRCGYSVFKEFGDLNGKRD